MSDTSALGPLVLDNETYGRVAGVFLADFVTRLIGQMLEDGRLDDTDVLAEADLDFLYRLCFVLMATLEDQRGLEIDGARRPAVLAFAEFPQDQPSLQPLTAQRFHVTDTRTDLHGGLTDELIRAAHAAARADRAG